MRAQVGCLLVIAGCMWSGLLAAQTIPVPAAKPAESDVEVGAVAALRELAVGPEVVAATVEMPGAPAPGPPQRLDAGDPGRQARGASPPDSPLGKLLGPTFGEPDGYGSDWGLSLGLRKSTALRPSLPGSGPRQELGLGAGVRIDLSDGVSLGGGYGYFSDDWAGYLRDERSSARPSESDGLDADRKHHVAGLRLTFEFEPPPIVR